MKRRHASSSSESKRWCSYFLANSVAADGLPWDDPQVLSSRERSAIQDSIQQFQLGEGSNGARLLRHGQAYSAATMDPDFASALALFVREEQRHSLCLLRFMRKQGIPPVTNHWIDNIFRLLRGLAGLELSLRVLVTAEIIAVPYYRALGRATNSPLLQTISKMILKDEASHLRFQASMLFRLGEGRAQVVQRLLRVTHRLFLLGTCFVVWVGHRSVFAAAGYAFRRLIRESLSELTALDIASSATCRPFPTSESYIPGPSRAPEIPEIVTGRRA
jgi:hypothetical protein